MGDETLGEHADLLRGIVYFTFLLHSIILFHFLFFYFNLEVLLKVIVFILILWIFILLLIGWLNYFSLFLRNKEQFSLLWIHNLLISIIDLLFFIFLKILKLLGSLVNIRLRLLLIRSTFTSSTSSLHFYNNLNFKYKQKN